MSEADYGVSALQTAGPGPSGHVTAATCAAQSASAKAPALR